MSVTGVRGRHAARAAATRIRRLPAVLGAAALAVILAIVVGYLAVQEPGAQPSGQSAAGQPGSGGQGAQLNTVSTAPVAQASQGAAVSAGPAATAGRQDPFGTAAAAYLSTRASTVLAAVYDVKTGLTWRLGQGKPQAAASVVKLDVLETLLAERRRGSGLPASDRSLAQQMIEDSDNAAATSLWYEVGGGARIHSFNAEAGLTQTAPSSCVVCQGFSWPGWGLTTTTPADQIALLKELIRPSSLLPDADRAYALSLMEQVIPDQRWGVSGGVPGQATVALKNGWLPLAGLDSDWQVNSVGWISGGGRDYLVAVLTTGNPTYQYGVDTIDRLAAMIWQDMG